MTAWYSVSSTEAREASPELARELAEELAEERTVARASANQLNSLGTVVANFACSSASRNRPTAFVRKGEYIANKYASCWQTEDRQTDVLRKAVHIGYDWYTVKISYGQ